VPAKGLNEFNYEVVTIDILKSYDAFLFGVPSHSTSDFSALWKVHICFPFSPRVDVIPLLVELLGREWQVQGHDVR
jgi:hypothetical protein